MTQPSIIGNRRELFVDDFLVDELKNAEFTLHNPEAREISLVTDKPWEGANCGYITVFRDGDICRMYYKSAGFVLESEDRDGPREPHIMSIGLALSPDGISWTRPDLGIIEFDGIKQNNLVWQGEGDQQRGIHGFAPFKDPNPACPADSRYKALGGIRRAVHGDLFAMKSPDGLNWSLLQEGPVMTGYKFDSQNLGFWDGLKGEYKAYVRDFKGGHPGGVRAIRTAASPDFVHWSEAVWLEYPDAPEEQLYTNQITPYFRAPHVYIGFPSRYVQRTWTDAIDDLPERKHRKKRSAVNERYGTALTDGLFMSSRDGRVFKRWGEAFLPPGPQTEGNWAYGDNYQCWGLLETQSNLEAAPSELSLYATEGSWRTKKFRRYTLRLDGFVSIKAMLSGGELVTKPVIFDGSRLRVNFATSAAGGIRVEIQSAEGVPLPGFSMDDAVELIGDETDRIVHWHNGGKVGTLAGIPVRLRFVMVDADLYSFRFERPTA